MDENNLAKAPYLNADQLEHAREEVQAMEPTAKDMERILALVDHYVRTNGLNDDDYERIFALANSVCRCQKMAEDSFPFLEATLPIMGALAFYNFLMIVGIFSSKEIDEMSAASRHGVNLHTIAKA